jgi:hypothetical protein
MKVSAFRLLVNPAKSFPRAAGLGIYVDGNFVGEYQSIAQLQFEKET